MENEATIRLGILPLATGLVGFCPLYPIVGFSTCAKKEQSTEEA